jgi:hypothetical protein
MAAFYSSAAEVVMQLRLAIGLAIGLCISAATANHPRTAFAATAAWVDSANGQGRSCDGMPGFEFFYPDNNNWSQQQVLGTDPCGNPNVQLEPTNWTTQFYPDNGNSGVNYDVILDAPANTVLDISVDIDSLTVANDGSLDMLGGTVLTIVQGTLVNDSTIVVNSNAGGAAILSMFSPTNTGLISGSGQIVLNQGNMGAWFAFGGSLSTQAAGHTIRGKGYLVAHMTNNGVIEAAETSGGGDPVLLVELTEHTNNNIFRATSGATLRLQDVKVTQDQATGRLIGDGPGVVGRGNVQLGDGAHIVGGRLEGQIDITDGIVILENVTNLSTAINSVPTTTTIIRGPNFTNNGRFSATSPVFNQFTNVKFESNTLLTGTGELFLGQFNAVRVTANPGVTITNDTNHTIAGQGKWFAPLVNHGMVESASISFENTTVQNNATMTTTTNGGMGFLNTPVTQNPVNGMLLVGMGAGINLTNSTVTNGVLEDTPSATAFSGFRASNATLVDVHNRARINVLRGSELRVIGAVFTNDGPITVNNDSLSSATKLEFQDSVLLQGSGDINLNEPNLGAQLEVLGGRQLTQAATHTIRGSGRIDAGLFINHGTVNLVPLINADVENYGSMNEIDVVNGDVLNQGTLSGLSFNLADLNGTLTGTGPLAYVRVNGVHSPGTSPANVNVTGTYAIGATGTLAMEIGGLTAGTEHDHIEVLPQGMISAGVAQLGGTLAVELIDAGAGLFVPSVGDMFTILNAADSVTGTFAALDLPTAAGGRGLTWQVHYNTADVTLELAFALTGDYNGNGVVDAADYVVWRKTLGQTGAGLAADGDGDMQVDDDDFDVWRANFGQLAPGAGAGAAVVQHAVPEPAAWTLALLAMICLLSVPDLRVERSGREDAPFRRCRCALASETLRSESSRACVAWNEQLSRKKMFHCRGNSGPRSSEPISKARRRRFPAPIPYAEKRVSTRWLSEVVRKRHDLMRRPRPERPRAPAAAMDS